MCEGQYEAQYGMKGNKTSRYLCDLKRALSSPLSKANGTRGLQDNKQATESRAKFNSKGRQRQAIEQETVPAQPTELVSGPRTGDRNNAWISDGGSISDITNN